MARAVMVNPASLQAHPVVESLLPPLSPEHGERLDWDIRRYGIKYPIRVGRSGDGLVGLANAHGTSPAEVEVSLRDARRWTCLYGSEHSLHAFWEEDDDWAFAVVRPFVFEGRPEPGVFVAEVHRDSGAVEAREPLDVEWITAWLRRQGFPVGTATWDLRPWSIEQPRPELPRRTGRTGTGYVYFVRGMDSGRIKIGFSSSRPIHRIASFRTGSPEQLEILGYIKQSETMNERILHERFAETRLHREWFAPSDALLAFIRENATNG